MLKHLKYIWGGLLLMGIAVGILVILATCTAFLSVVSCPWMWGVLMLLIVAWAIGRLLDPAI